MGLANSRPASPNHTVKEVIGGREVADDNPVPVKVVEGGGGGPANVGIKDALDVRINPSTEEKLEAVRAILDDRLPDEFGSPAYTAGAGGGTVNVPAGARLQGISAWAEGSDGSFTVDGGAAVTVRKDAGKDWNPKGRWVAPAVVFSASLDYVVEWTVADSP